MIKVEYLGRTGNNLFQYSLGRILATVLCQRLQAKEIAGFPRTNDIVEGKSNTSSFCFHSGNRIPLNDILATRNAEGHVLRGYFQRTEYYLEFRDQINEWLAFDSRERNAIPEDFLVNRHDAVVVNVRRTDYTQNNWALPASYYKEALERFQLKKNNVWIVTEDPRDPFFRNFKDYKPRFLNLSPVSQLAAMSISKNLIMSASSFSWWGAFLGENKNVVCPRPTFGCWSINNQDSGIDLINGLDFDLLDCATEYHATPLESFYQQYRLFKRKWIIRLNRRLGFRLDIPPQ
jgi:hypothetical protein